MLIRTLGALALLCVVVAAQPATGATVPFTEEFSVDDSSWQDGSFGAPSYLGAGGQAGGYISTSFNFGQAGAAAGDTVVLFRGQPFSSGGNFVGNWIADGVTDVSMWVRHDWIGNPLNFSLRVAGPANFPGAIGIQFAPTIGIPGPAGWTQLIWDVSPGSPQLVSFEGTSYGAVFSNVGIVQLFLEVPASLVGLDQDITFDLDTVSIAGAAAPEPSSLLLLTLAGLGAALARRRAA